METLSILNIRNTLFFIASWILFSGLLKSQPGNFRFTRVESPDLPVSIHDIDQDSLGFIWISCNSGLLRWDGTDVIRLQHVEGDSNSLAHNAVLNLHIAKGGIFWIATYDGLCRFDSKTQTFTHYLGSGPNPVLPGPIVYCLGEDADGQIWVGTRRNGLARLDPQTGNSTIYQHDPQSPGSISGNRIADILVDDKGRVWVAVKDGGVDLFLPQSNSFKNYPAEPGNEFALTSNRMRDLAPGPDGSLLIGASAGGFSELDPETGRFKHNLHDPQDSTSLSSNEGYSLLYDSQGNYWVGTWSKGLNFKAKNSEVFRCFPEVPNDPTALHDDVILKIFEDRQGLIWIGTNNAGLFVYDPSMERRFIHYRQQPTNPNSLSNNSLGGLLQVSDNELWIGTIGSGLNIYYRDEDRFEFHEHVPGDPTTLPNNGVWALLKDSKKRIWASTSRGISLWNPDQHNFTSYGFDQGEPPLISNRNIISMEEGPEGNIWLGTWGGGLNFFDPETKQFTQMEGSAPSRLNLNKVKAIHLHQSGKIWLGGTTGLRTYDPATKTFFNYEQDKSDPTQPGVANINCLIEAPDGDIWIGAGDGLEKYDAQSQTFERFDSVPGLENLNVFGASLDPRGRLWFSTNIALKVLQPETKDVKTYSYIDGIQSNDFASFSYTGSGQERLLFGGTNGLTEVKTGFGENLSLPPVVFTDFRLFNQVQAPDPNGPLMNSIDQATEVLLTYEDYLFSFGFAALDYRKPKAHQYAYRLTGFDENWINTDQNNRRATFTNVPHGNYLLEVKASPDGILWGAPTTLKVTVLPPWWKTWWARTLFAAAVLLLLFGIYTVRVRSLRKQKRVLEVQVKERTAEVVAQAEVISLEKSRSEALLLNILPESIAEELKTNEKAETRHFDSVSVLFTDFVGFTQIAERLSPEALVQELDLFFRGFDGIVGRLELEKIKTIGDAYMCAGGLPDPKPNHAVLMVEAGLEMLELVRQTNVVRQRENRPTWDIRIGIHSGPVVAGVVGNKKFAYDIWGDAVNTASRMESSGEVNHLNISQSTYELVKNAFTCTFRGKVHAKNKGEIEMYRVESKLRN